MIKRKLCGQLEYRHTQFTDTPIAVSSSVAAKLDDLRKQLEENRQKTEAAKARLSRSRNKKGAGRNQSNKKKKKLEQEIADSDAAVKRDADAATAAATAEAQAKVDEAAQVEANNIVEKIKAEEEKKNELEKKIVAVEGDYKQREKDFDETYNDDFADNDDDATRKWETLRNSLMSGN